MADDAPQMDFAQMGELMKLVQNVDLSQVAKLAEKVEEWSDWATSIEGLQYTFASNQRRPHVVGKTGDIHIHVVPDTAP